MDEWSRVDLSQLFDLSGRVVLMAGGAGVLGCVACEALAAHGATVVIGDNRLVAAMATAYSMVEKGLAAHPIEVDLGDEASILPAIDQVHQRFGRLDVAINAVTYSTGKPMEQMTQAEWKAGPKVSLTGSFLFARAAGKVMVEQGGGASSNSPACTGWSVPTPGCTSRR